MCRQLSLLILLAIGELAELLPLKNSVNGKENNSSSWCESPFELVNTGCYYFSELQVNFEDASELCEIYSHTNDNYEVSLAMLGYDRDEDQALLDAVTSKNKTFWLGGKTENGNAWSWLDGREFNSDSPLWDFREPDEDGNMCITAQKNTYNLATATRSYIYDHNCLDSINFICKTGKTNCPPDFIKIDNYCYLQSRTIEVPDLSWQEARDYCKSLSLPVAYRADLAVLGLQDQDDYSLINKLVNIDGYTWIGAYTDAVECSFQWIDGRELPLKSIYWKYERPYCGSNYRVSLYHSTSHKRTSLNDRSDTALPFICQMLKNIAGSST